MKSYHWKKTVAVMVLLILTACASSVLAQGSRNGSPPFPPPPTQWAVQGDYLYILDMRSIHQYSLSDMRLKQTVILPETQSLDLTAAREGGPPMPPRMTSLLAEGEALYILELRSIHKYTLPDLDFVQTVTLPEPDDAIE